jgi:hypothetical protein
MLLDATIITTKHFSTKQVEVGLDTTGKKKLLDAISS